MRRWLPWIFSATMLILAFVLYPREAPGALGAILGRFVTSVIVAVVFTALCFVVYQLYRLVRGRSNA